MGEQIKVIVHDGKDTLERLLELVTPREVSERGLVPVEDNKYGLIVVHRNGNGFGTVFEQGAFRVYDIGVDYRVPDDAVAIMTGGIVANASGEYQPFHFFTKGKPQTSEQLR